MADIVSGHHVPRPLWGHDHANQASPSFVAVSRHRSDVPLIGVSDHMLVGHGRGNIHGMPTIPRARRPYVLAVTIWHVDNAGGSAIAQSTWIS